jgi:hypothetical protein
MSKLAIAAAGAAATLGICASLIPTSSAQAAAPTTIVLKAAHVKGGVVVVSNRTP